ncbi:transposase [Mesorhizobium sp. C120A]|uniref:IS110 family transposase n=1 Tax=unclassified Mesorhizobium TaxID=325217 RepID=UPI001FD88C7A|nr:MULTISPECIES: transposase [unclassified Mesorhizobium]WJI44805.1 transposase [Mesorhizobium sp. C120A]
MRRVIGMDIHRTFAEVVVWEGGRLRHHGRVGMTRSGLEGFGRSLRRTVEVDVEATGNAMAVVRLLSPYVGRVIVANPMQMKAIAHAMIKTDKIDAGVLAQLHASGFLPEVWVPDERTERLRRLVARRNQVVRHRTRVKNEVHGILQAHLVPKGPHADLFSNRGAPGSSGRCFPTTSGPLSPATSGTSIAWPRIWLTSIATSPGQRLMMRKSGAFRRSPASMSSSRAVSSPRSATSGGSANRRSW